MINYYWRVKVFIVLSGMIPLIGVAETPEKCDIYAEQAVGQFIRGQKLGCNFSFNGGQWMDNVEGHYGFCLQAPPERILKETKMRADALSACKAQKDKEEQCKQYANTAIRQYKKSLAAECGFGFEGGRWMDNYKDHYGWCLKVNPKDADSETKARANALIRCVTE